MKNRILILAVLALLVGACISPAWAACPVSWRSKTLTYTRACTFIELADNLTQKDAFILENLTRAENTAAQMVQANLTIGGNVSVPATSTTDAFVLFTDTLGHTFKDSLTTIAGLAASIVNQGVLAHVENDTVTKAAAIKWASDSDTANSSASQTAVAIKWASDSDTANRTGTVNDAALAAAGNRTLAANLSIMAQSLVVPSTGGATLYAPNETLGAVPVTYVGFPRGVWNASIVLMMPTAWTGGPLTAAFYWTADSSAGTVEWDFAGRCAGTDNQVIDSYLGANTTILDTMGTKDSVYISDATAGTTMAGTPAGGAYCLLNFRRLSGAGSLPSEAKLLGVRIYYPVV
jgi:hypothetical protein